MRIVYLEEASDDLKRIVEYVARSSGSVDVAMRVARRIRSHCRRIAALNGTLGRDRSDLKEGMRSTVLGNYIVFFFYRSRRMEVVAVVEGHRDLETYFDDVE